MLIIINHIFITGNASATRSELPEYIKEQSHNDITYTVITEKNLNDLDNIIAKAKLKHFLVLQPKYESLTPDHALKLLDWVRQGGVLWYYDSRFAPLLGMENAPVSADDVKGQPHEGEYGTCTVPGINMIAYVYPFTEHPVATGVQAIQAFLIEIGPGRYSAVSDKTEGVEPIFIGSPEGSAIVAMKKIGEGWIVFKPLLWPEVLGGERFQLNLMEFSAGYPVPKGEKPVIPPEALQGKLVMLPRYDNLILSDGQQVLGMVTDSELEFIGGEGTVKYQVKDIDSIAFSPTGTEVTLIGGITFKGSLLTISVNFKTSTGKQLSIDKENIVSIKFNAGR